MAQPRVCRVAVAEDPLERAVNVPANEPAANSFVPNRENQRELRHALGCFGTGVTVVTIDTAEGPFGMTVNSFSSVSLDPPLILWSVDKRSARCRNFENAEHFTVNVLQQNQQDVAGDFAKNPMAFREGLWRNGGYGSPVLNHCLATFECVRETHYAGGDHTIILGRVLQATVNNGVPLLFFRGEFGSVA